MFSRFFFAVRAGSVIFLVGVGSLVCWKLWEHWRSGADSPRVAPPTPSTSPEPRRPRGLLASLLEEDLVQDLDEYDDEDPAFIHVSTPGEWKGTRGGAPMDWGERRRSRRSWQWILQAASSFVAGGNQKAATYTYGSC